jgi:outer membrane protein assembly factor BamB
MRCAGKRWAGLLLVGTVALSCASANWSTYRFDTFREANQRATSPVSDPAQLAGLAVQWTFPSSGNEGGSFYASPIVVNNHVFIGSTSGRFYALNADTGALLWQYPPAGQPPLLGTCFGGAGPQTFGHYGIMSSAVDFDGLVIFGASDPVVESGLGSGRLYALHESDGSLAWASDVVAHVNGCTSGNGSELHERIAYSAPLVMGRTVYVGVHDAGDDPIQNGKVVAVSADTGHLIPGFSFSSTTTRGGGVWNAPASDLSGVYVTTGNTRCYAENGQFVCQAEPAVNRGLSMLRLNPSTGVPAWQFQAVPYALDNDPDWAAGVTLMLTSCGELAASVQKDGWVYAVDSATGACRWQFPPTAPAPPSPGACKFPLTDPMLHGDKDYKRPGAVWGDVLIINAGGEGLVQDGYPAGYARLHALNACAPDEPHRVRWIADVPHATAGSGYAIGAPTVSNGIVYIPTDQGHIVALADPSIVPSPGNRCSDESIPVASCVAAGYVLVPSPAVVADVALPGLENAAGLRNEIAIAGGRLFVGTLGGHVFMLAPNGPPQPPCATPNACNGCSTLYAAPHAGCEEGGKCGQWKCVGHEAVTCDTTLGEPNACLGCSLMPLPRSGHGRGDQCICNDPAQQSGILTCSADKNHLVCCPCNSAPGCGPGSP